MAQTLDELIDGAWVSLRGNFFRRALLGKQRCSELVMLSCASFPDRELLGCMDGSAHAKAVQAALVDRVAAKYRQTRGAAIQAEPYGMVFLSIVLMWAVSAIVQYLVVKWWQKHFDAAAIRKQYGWSYEQ